MSYRIEPDNIYHDDCLTGMQFVADRSVDMILCDLPYGTTENKWDAVIPLEPLWDQYRRIIKANGAVVLTAQMPFASVLVASNLRWFRHEWIWEKPNATGFFNAKKAPLKCHDNIQVFAPGKLTYNPQMVSSEPYTMIRGHRKVAETYGGDRGGRRADDTMRIYEGVRYPRTILRFHREVGNIHPTQKPVALFEYLIRTYTNLGDLVLDNCIGSGTTAIACINTERHYIGFEKDATYFAAAQERIRHYDAPIVALVMDSPAKIAAPSLDLFDEECTA